MKEIVAEEFDENEYLKRKTIVEEEVDWSKVDKKSFDVLSERIADYREATEYVLN